MRKIGLFSIEETRAIMKKRKRFEYKTQRRTKEKEVYLQYIQYEISVQQLVKLRREKRGIEIEKDRIEKPMALRIYRLFRMACFRFKSDVKLWLTHIDFSKKNHDRERVSKLFTTMLKVHNKKPNLWLMAAKFEFEDNESVETARSLFQRALRLLPNKKKIWVEYFKMELMCVDLIMKRKELLGLTDQAELETLEDASGKNIEKKDDVSTEEDAEKKVEDAILSCKIVEVVFLNALKQADKNTEEEENIQESIPELVFKMIRIANEFKFTESLIDRMYKFIESDVKLIKFEESWNLLARRSLLQEASILKKCEETGQCADFTIAEFEDRTNEVFLHSLKELNTEKMHHVYLNFCIERLKLNSNFLNEERFKRLNEAFKKTESLFGLPLDYTIEWIETLTKFSEFSDTNELINRIQEALVKHNKSGDLWKLYLTTKIDQTTEANEQELIDLFYKSISSVSEKNGLDLWKLMVNWCLLSNHKCTETILQKGSQIMNQEISTFCRLRFMHWSMHNPKRNEKVNGLAKVRKVYESLRKVPPYSVDFYHKYIEIENSAVSVDDARVKSAYEDALLHFAANDMDLWIAYITFVYSRSNREELQEISNIYWRAMKQLNTELVDGFTQKFCLFKINLDDKNKLITSPDDYDIEMDN